MSFIILWFYLLPDLFIFLRANLLIQLLLSNNNNKVSNILLHTTNNLNQSNIKSHRLTSTKRVRQKRLFVDHLKMDVKIT